VKDRRAVGVLTSKDVLRLVRDGVDINRPVSAYMNAPVKTLSNEATLKEAMDFMKDTGFHRIVTVDKYGNLVGSLTYKELLSIAHSSWMSTLTRYQRELLDQNEELERKTQKFEKIAAYDILTGLYNRRKFTELFVLEHTVMVERGNTMTLMLIDVDHFKSVNDNYGHNTGDEVLKAVAGILKSAFRDVDIVARWGGDEFVALLPAADELTAYTIAEERVRAKVKSLEIVPTGVSVSIGIGVVSYEDDIHTAVGKADEMLYRAKEKGRDCVASEHYASR
jgi:diguanylate cyclase (GGDEF)-like protein